MAILPGMNWRSGQRPVILIMLRYLRNVVNLCTDLVRVREAATRLRVLGSTQPLLRTSEFANHGCPRKRGSGPSPPVPTSRWSIRMLGHSSGPMTLDTYGHLFEDRLDEVGDAMDRARKQPRRRSRLHPVAPTDTAVAPVLPEPVSVPNAEAAPISVSAGQDRNSALHPRPDSNRRYRRERAGSWAARRRGPATPDEAGAAPTA